MSSHAGLLSVAIRNPPREISVEDIFKAESAELTPSFENRLGIRRVHACDGEGMAELALGACRDALESSGITASKVDLIVDYSTLPQHYLVPAWNMSNLLQHELGATRSITLGFSGGGASNFLVALKAAADLIATDDDVSTALLVGEDRALPGNRLLNPNSPHTIIGDGAGAVVLRAGQGSRILGTELSSEADYHNVCFIPGGALAHPDRPDLYRLVLDMARYEGAPRTETLVGLTDRLLARFGLSRGDVAKYIFPNQSAYDRRELARAFGRKELPSDSGSLADYGHMLGHDLVLNFHRSTDSLHAGDYVVLCSHGMGFMYGATLIRYEPISTHYPPGDKP